MLKVFAGYESPSVFSRAVMAAGDALSWVLVPRRPLPRLPLEPGAVQQLLLLRLDGIGDNVCSWPTLALLRDKFPAARITVVVGPWAAPLYRECPWIDELIAWDTGLYGFFRGKGFSRLLQGLKICGRLRTGQMEVGIDLRGDLRSIVLLWLLAAKARIAQVSRGGRRFLTDPLVTKGRYEVQRTYDVALSALGLPAAAAPRIRDWPRPEALSKARAKLAAAGWDSDAPTVALCPLALWPWKQWPAERFSSLALRLKKEFGLQVVWFVERAEQAGKYAQDDPVFCGPLDQVAAALSLCRLAVSNDTGLLHLAVAAGCRTVQLFGPGEAECFAHKGTGLALLHDTTCQDYPCIQRGKCANTSGGWCLEKIEVEEVFASCALLMAEGIDLDSARNQQRSYNQ